jgi:beta-1,4-mannooligosaccharide/beta-1,4-mannosyl-N-acetylglucosamine phosphorylase
VPYGEGFAGVFRVDDRSRSMNIHAGHSTDGVVWRIEADPIRFLRADERVLEADVPFEHAYDARLTWLEDRYGAQPPVRDPGGHPRMSVV